MIILKLQGGLGNQMFQYAAAKRIAGNKPIYFDMEFLNAQTIATSSFTPRGLELSVFPNVKINEVKNKVALRIIKSNKALYALLKKMPFNNLLMIRQSEKNEFIELPNLTSSTIYLDGYFQDEAYFKAIKQQLFEDFQFPASTTEGESIKNAIISANNTVSIHIRRGDYLKPQINAYHGLLPLSYYQKAKKQIEAKITSPHYYIFSDDPEWCRKNINFFGGNSTIVSKTIDNAWEDMFLMSLCKHNIIANSSYSWWGAWLNKNPDKVVIAPHNWFTSVTTNIVPKHWIKI